MVKNVNVETKLAFGQTLFYKCLIFFFLYKNKTIRNRKLSILIRKRFRLAKHSVKTNGRDSVKIDESFFFFFLLSVIIKFRISFRRNISAIFNGNAIAIQLIISESSRVLPAIENLEI